MDLPGYHKENIERVLDEYGRGGLAGDWMDSTDSSRRKESLAKIPILTGRG
jgi:hypothetical protein